MSSLGELAILNGLVQGRATLYSCIKKIPDAKKWSTITPSYLFGESLLQNVKAVAPSAPRGSAFVQAVDMTYPWSIRGRHTTTCEKRIE